MKAEITKKERRISNIFADFINKLRSDLLLSQYDFNNENETKKTERTGILDLVSEFSKPINDGLSNLGSGFSEF